MTVRFGVMAPFADGLITNGDFLQAFAATLEDCGADSVWTVEHVVIAEEYEPLYPYSADGRITGGGAAPMPDPLELLSFFACASTRLRLGTAMVVAPLHAPAVLAKRAATVERLSGGRLMLGLGIGWQKEEYAAVGVPYRDRGRRLEECIHAMRALWTEDPANYHGRYVEFEQVHSRPQPGGAIPIVVGGNSEPAVRRAGRIADGWFPFTISPEDFAAGADLLRQEAGAAGRRSEDIKLTAWPGSFEPALEEDLDFVQSYVRAGASRLIVRPQIRRPDHLGVLREQLERYRDQVVAKL